MFKKYLVPILLIFLLMSIVVIGAPTYVNIGPTTDFEGDVGVPSGSNYYINDIQITSDVLSDVAYIAMLDENETITGDWVNTDNPWADDEVANDITIDLATLATTLTIVDNESTDESNAVLFTSGGVHAGDLNIESDGDLVYNPSTGTLSAPIFVGDGSQLTDVGIAAATSLTLEVRADGDIKKGEAVYVSGSIGAAYPKVAVADADDPAKIRVIGIAADDISDTATGFIRMKGLLTDIDTEGPTDCNPGDEDWDPGQLLYLLLDGSGGYTETRPTSGRVIKVAYSLYGDNNSDAFVVICHENPTSMAAAVDEDILIRMGDALGVKKVYFKDYADAEVASIDSDGGATFDFVKVYDVTETTARNAGWWEIKTTAVTGDLTGLRSKMESNAASGGDAPTGLNVRGIYGQAKVTASKHVGLLQGGLFVADVSAGSCVAYNVHVLAGHYSSGASTVIGGDLYVGYLKSQTRSTDPWTITGTSSLLALENEAIEGNGAVIDSAIRIFDTNIAAAGFTYGIDMSDSTIATADIRLSFGETISNIVDGRVTIGGADLNIDTGKKYMINGTALAVGDITGAAASGANTDITSLAGLTTPLGPAYGGTGVANAAGETITLVGDDAITFTTSAATNVTLPTSGTLVNSAVTTLSSLVSIGTIATGVWEGTDVGLAHGGTGVSTGAMVNFTSILNVALYVGRDADNQIKFADDNTILFRVAGVDGVSFISTGELDMGANSVGFTAQTDGGDGTTTIDWTAGNYFIFTHGDMAETFTFDPAPTNPCHLTLIVLEDANGGHDCTWPATVKWLGDEPTWTDGGASKGIVVAMVYDGTSYWSQGTPWEE